MRPTSATGRLLGVTAFALLTSFALGQATQLQNGWPQPNAPILAMALDETSGVLYIGGDFTEVDGQERIRLAAFDITTGSLTTWAPGANNQVRSMTLTGDSVIIGGTFETVNGEPRSRLASITKDTGALTAWAPVANNAVNCMLTDANTLFIGGQFTEMAGQTRNRLAAFELATGSLTAWDPNAGSIVNKMAWNGSHILVGGVFPIVGGATRGNLAELNASTGLATGWVANTNSAVAALEVSGGRVFAGGQFTLVNGEARQSVVELDPADGTVLPFSCAPAGLVRSLAYANNTLFVGGFYSSMNGSPPGNLAALNATTGAVREDSPNANSTVNAMILHDQRLYVAGAFTAVNGNTPRGRFAVYGYCVETPWYADVDEDGLGDPGDSVLACEAPEGFVGNSDDCNDADAEVGAPLTWYFDADEDGSGDPLITVVDCTQPAGYTESGNDCDDADPAIYQDSSCDDGDPYTVFDAWTFPPDCECIGLNVLLSAKVILEGPYDPLTGLMSDSLRVQGLIPLTEPYTALGFDMQDLLMAGGDVIDPSVLEVSGPNAIVDWVILEFRQVVDNTNVLSIRCALLQRDGDVVDVDGISPVRMPIGFGFYHLGILHRNHMGVVTSMTNGQYYEHTTVDFTDPGLQLFGDAPVAMVGSIAVLRSGDTSFNDEVSYVGQNNDRDPVLVAIGGGTPTATATGYLLEDTNMDGMVRYTGPGNDRDPILQTVGGSTPTAVRPHVYRRPTY